MIERPEFIIANGAMLDGSGAEPILADLAIARGKIAAIGHGLAERHPEAEIVDAEGEFVAPGFIDVHSHSDHYLLVNGLAESKVRQGVTTEICGNCGASSAPWRGVCRDRWSGEFEERYGLKAEWTTFDEFLDRMDDNGLSVNFASFVGHNTIRSSTIGYDSRPAAPEEMERMKEEVREAMGAGAMGLSTGLAYPPGSHVGTEEVIELTRAAAELGGIYATHMRDEGDALIEAVEEALQICRETGAQGQISHLKTFGRKNWGKMGAAVDLIERARAEGVAVLVDRYPYLAGGTSLDMAMPRWALQDGNPKILLRISDEGVWRKIREEMIAARPRPEDWSDLMISIAGLGENRRFEGKTVQQAAAEENMEPVDFYRRILLEENLLVDAFFFVMCEENLERALALPYCMIGSDATARDHYSPLGAGNPHPRAFGTFPKFLAEWVFEKKSFTVQEAVHKITGLPAKTFGMAGRGTLREGNWADLTVFSSEVRDAATYRDPVRYPAGVRHVFVNGRWTVRDGVHLGVRAGKVLRRSKGVVH